MYGFPKNSILLSLALVCLCTASNHTNRQCQLAANNNHVQYGCSGPNTLQSSMWANPDFSPNPDMHSVYLEANELVSSAKSLLRSMIITSQAERKEVEEDNERESQCGATYRNQPNQHETVLAIESDDSFDLQKDAILLRDTLNSFTGPNIELIIDILTHRSNDQRLKIDTYLKTVFNTDLVDEFNKLPGYVKYLLTALMRDLPQFNAKNLYKNWVPHLAHKSNMLLHILTTLSKAEMQIIEEAHRQLKTNIEYVIIKQLQKRLEDDKEEFVNYLLDETTIGETEVKQHGDSHPDYSEDSFYFAEILHRALYDLDPDLKTITAILTRRRKEEILEIAKTYNVKYDKDLVKALEETLEGDSRDVLIALVSAQPDFNKIWLPFADMPNVIVEILLSASDNEIETVNKAYKQLFSIIEYTLQSMVQCGFLEDNKLGAINNLLVGTHPKTPYTTSNHTIGGLSRRCISQRLLATNTKQVQQGSSGPNPLQPSMWTNGYFSPSPDMHSVYLQARDLVSSAKSLLHGIVVTPQAKRTEIEEDSERELQCGASYRNQRNQHETVLAIESDDSFDLQKDAILLRDTLNSFRGPNIELIIDILTHRSNDQRLKIDTYLKTVFNTDLVEEFNKLPGYVKYLLTALMRDLPQFNAKNFYKNWVPHLAHKSNMLFQILTTLSKTEMELIEEAYRQLKTNIEYEIIVQLQNGLKEDKEEFVNYLLDETTIGEKTQMKQHGDTESDHSEDSFYFAEILHRALYDLDPDVETIIAILTRRSNEEILEIAKTYKVKYDKDLVKALEETLEGDSRDVLMALVSPQPDFKKIWLPFTDMPNVIFDILIGASDAEVETINKGYKRLFSIIENTLQSMVQYGVLDHKNLGAVDVLLGGTTYPTIPIFNCNRDPTTVARKLHNAKNGQHKHEETMIEIFTSCSREQRLAVAESYNTLYGKQLDTHLNSVIRDKNLRVVIKALLTPFPEFNSRYFYKYLVPLIKYPESMFNALNHIPDKRKDTISDTCDKLRAAMEKQLLIILKYRLWENKRLDNMNSFIEKVRSATQETLNSGHTSWYSNSVKYAKELYNALSYKDIIKILTPLTIEQRTEIVKTFKYLYKMDLASVLLSRLGDKYLQDTIVVWLTPFVSINASALYDKWLTPATSSSNIIRAIKSTFPNGLIKGVNEELQLNMDKTLVPLLFKQNTAYIADIIAEDSTKGPENTKKEGTETHTPSMGEESTEVKVTPNPLITEENQHKPVRNFDANNSARSLAQALKDNNETTILGNLTHCSYIERIGIAEAFQHIFGKTSLRHLLARLPSSLGNVTKALVTQWPELYAEEIHRNSKNAIIDTVVDSSSGFLKSIRKSFNKLYRKAELRDVVQNALPKIPKRFVKFLLEGQRNEDMEFNERQSEEFIEIFGNLNETSFTTTKEMNKAIRILTTNSEENVRKMIVQYEMRYNESIETALKRLGTHGDFSKIISSKIRATKSTPKYYAHQLYESMHSGKTEEKERNFIRIIIGHSGTDLHEIQKAFYTEYKTTLITTIQEQHDVYYRRTYGAVIEASYSRGETLTGEKWIEESQHESKTHQNAPYDPKLYATKLHNALWTADKIAITEILTSCSSNQQRSEVLVTYQQMFEKDLISELDNKFNSTSDRSFHDILVAYLTSLPDFNSLYSFNNWIPEAERSQDVNKLLTSTETSDGIEVIKKAYENLTQYINSYLLSILHKPLHDENLESSYPTTDANASESRVTESDISETITKDVELLTTAWNNNVLDSQVIADILYNRTYNQRWGITKALEKIYKMNLYDRNTSDVENKIRYLYIALIKPLPIIDGPTLLSSWIPPSKRFSKILDTVLKSTDIHMEPLKVACANLKSHIEKRMLSTLQDYENKTYNPRRYASNLNKAIVAANKIAITEILTSCSSNQQRSEVLVTYQQMFEKDLISEVDNKFNSTSDRSFHDILVAYLTSLPDFNSLYSFNNWIPEAERSQDVNKLLNSRETSDVIEVIKKAYENLTQYINSYLLSILHKPLHDENLESSYPTTDENASESRVTESEISETVTKDVQLLTTALNNSVLDSQVIADILYNRTYNQRLGITKALEKIYKMNLYDRNTSDVENKIRYLYIALIKPLPIIDGPTLLSSWIPPSKRFSKILDTVLKSTDIHMEPLKVACANLKSHIEKRMLSTLQDYENKTYNPRRYASNLNKAIVAADKIAITEILTSCSSNQQRSEVLVTYQQMFEKDFISEVDIKFNSTSDRSFHDILVAYLTSLPDFNSLYSFNNWIPEAERSQDVNKLLTSRETSDGIEVIKKAYENLTQYINSYLLSILHKPLHGENLESSYPTTDEKASESRVTESEISETVTKDVQLLTTALNNSVLDSQVIADILYNRTYNQRLGITKALEKIYKMNLYDRNTSDVENKIRYLYIALIKPLPIIDGPTLLSSWIPPSKRFSKILDTVLKSTDIHMEPLKVACANLKSHIEKRMLSTLQDYENKTYNPRRYASNLNKAIVAANKIAITEILTSCSSNQQRSEVLVTYQQMFEKDFISEVDIKCNSTSDRSFHDILVAYLTSLPDFNSLYSFNNWIPEAERSQDVNKLLTSRETSDGIEVIKKAYENLTQYINSYLLSILHKPLHGENLESSYPTTDEKASESRVTESEISETVTKDVQLLTTALNNSVLDSQVIADILYNRTYNQRWGITKALEKIYKMNLYDRNTSDVENKLRYLYIALIKPLPIIDGPTLLSSWIPPSKRFSKILDTVLKSTDIHMEPLKVACTNLKSHIEKRMLSTLQDYENKTYNPRRYASNLNKAIVAANKIAITEILTSCSSNQQRSEVLVTYQQMFEKDFISEVDNKFNSTSDRSFHDILVAYLTSLPDFNSLYSFNNWIPEAERSQDVNKLLTSRETADGIEVIKKTYENLTQNINNYLLSILHKPLHDENLESSYPTTDENASESRVTESDISETVTKDVQLLTTALNNNVLDRQVIEDILYNRTYNQRWGITKALEKIYKMNLYDRNTSDVENKIRYLYIALIKPLPIIDGPTLFNSWIPPSKRFSKILDTVLKSTDIQMEPLKVACAKLKSHIEKKMLSTLQDYENKTYNPRRYASNLNKAIVAANKIAITEILTSCSSNQQRSEVLVTYQQMFKKDFISEVDNKFNSTSDRSFHDILVAYLTSLPDFNSLYSFNNWIPEAERSQDVNKLLTSRETADGIEVIKKAYENLTQNINNYLLSILHKPLHDENLESSYPTTDENATESRATESEISDTVTKDVRDLSILLNAALVDKKVIVEILTRRTNSQRWGITKALEKMFKTNLYDKNPSSAKEKMHILYLALLKPFPIIDGQTLLNSWIPSTKRLSKTLDTVLKSTDIQMKPLRDSCALLKSHIEEKLISTLQVYEAEAYDPKRYATTLYNAIKAADKTGINVILTHLTSSGRLETSKQYADFYKKEIISELNSQFNSSSDGQYTDITLAFLTPLPSVKDFYDHWVPMLKRSNVRHDIVSSFDYVAIGKAYLKLKLYIESTLSKILQDRLYEGNSLAKEHLLTEEKDSETQVVPADNSFDASEDAKLLYTALYSTPVDTQLIVKTLLQRHLDQHYNIAQAFEKLYNKILVLELDSRLEGNLHDLAIALVTQFPVNVQTLFGIWIPSSNRLSNILNSIAKSYSPEITAFNKEAKHVKDGMEDKLKSTLHQYGDQEFRRKEVASIFPVINFDADHNGNALFKLISTAEIDYAAITQLMRVYSNEQRLEIIKSLTLKHGNEVLSKFLSTTGKDPSQDISIALLSPLPKFDKQEFYKLWFGSNLAKKTKKTHIILNILNSFSATEMSNFSELYKQLTVIIEYELSRERSWKDNKLSAVKFNGLQPTPVGNTFNAENDASSFEKAMSGDKIDYTAIIEIFVSRNSDQRLEIAKSFKAQFGKDLVNEFQNSRLEGYFSDIVVALMTPPPEFYKTWMPFSDGPNVVNNILATSYSVQMEAINKVYQRLCQIMEKQLTIMLRTRVWEGIYFQRIISLLKETTGHIKEQLTAKKLDQYAEQLNKVMNSPELRQTVINIFKITNSNDRLQIAETYKRLYKNDLVEEFKSKLNDPYFYDVMEALMTPFPEFNDDKFLRKLLPKTDIETNQLEILKFFSKAEIKAVREAYTRLQLSIESNLKEFSQNRLWESKKVDQLYGFFKEMRDETPTYPAKYADELYGMWLPSSSTHHIWSTLSSGYLQDFDEACERLQFYIQNRYKLFSSEEYMSLKDIDRQSIGHLIGTSSIETQQHEHNYNKYAEKLKTALNVPTLKETIMEIFINCNTADIEAIANAYKKTYKNDLSKELNAVLPKDYFHDVIIALLQPFPDFNVEVVYKYWAQMLSRTDGLKHNIRTFEVETNNVKEAYTQLKLYIQNKILYIFRNRLWESQRFNPMSIFIKKISSGMQIRQHDGAPLVPPSGSFYPGNDAITMSNAVNDKLVRIRKIIQIINDRSYYQRSEIAKPITSLVSDLNSKLYGNIHNIIMALMTPYPDVNAQTLFNEWELQQFRSTNIVNILTTLSIDYIEAFNGASIKIKLYLDSELKKALHDLPNPKCLQIKVSKPVPSIRPADVFDPQKDAKALDVALEKKKEDTITSILTHRSYEQRLAIAQVLKDGRYKNKDLLQALKNKFKYGFRSVTVALMTSFPAERAAFFRDYSATHLDKPYGIIDFLATTSNADIADAISRYPNSELQDITLSVFEGVSKDMAKDILDGKRSETEAVNASEADDDATFLFELGADRFFRTVEEEQRVAAIFARRSHSHLRKVIELYENSFKECIEAAIKQRGLHRDLETLVLAIIHATKSIPDYYAERLYDALRGTYMIFDANLIRLVVGRSEIDLQDIKEAFDKKYKIDGKNTSLMKLIDLQKNNKRSPYLDAIKAVVEPR